FVRGEQTRRGPDTFARATGAAADPRKSKDGGALPRGTFGDGGAARRAGPFPCRRESEMPNRRSADGKGISRRSILAYSSETVSARRLHRRAPLCGACGIGENTSTRDSFSVCASA